MVDVDETATAQQGSDQFIAIKPGKDVEALWILRALSQGVELDATIVETETGVSLSTWQGLMDRMKRARYGVVLCRFRAGRMPSERHHCSYAMFSLVRDMNAHARFVFVPLGAPGNAAGADNVLTWQTGLPVRDQPRPRLSAIRTERLHCRRRAGTRRV